uniref:Uncharacterized protein n=1 Tax=Panagrolaimus sp. PS1159 TaxID=55785 RepID=A0AC35GFK6_9BILA
MCSNKRSSASTIETKKSEKKSKKAEEKIQIVPEHFVSPEPPILAKESSVENHLEITDPTTAKVPSYVQQQEQQKIKKTSSAEPLPPKNNQQQQQQQEIKKTSSAEPLPPKNNQQQQQYSAEPASAKNQQTTSKPRTFVLPTSTEGTNEIKSKSEIHAVTAKQPHPPPPKSPATDSTDLRTPDWMKDPNEHKIRIS